MNLARSTYYDEPAGQPMGEAKVVEKIGEICAEYPRYGYRRVTAQLRRDGVVVNHKRAMRIMREQGLSVRPAPAVRRHNRQQSRGSDLPQPRQGADPSWSERAVGCRPDFHRHRARLRLPRCHPRCLVATRGRLCPRAGHRRAG